jgi:mono/diheme cytochrome c family protein
MRFVKVIAIVGLAWPLPLVAGEADPVRFREQVAPIFKAHCLRCHQGKSPKGDLDLSSPSSVIEGRGAGQVVVAGKPEDSRLLEVISGDKPTMPKSGDRLDPSQVALIRSWIAEGANWPEGEVLKLDPTDWWSLRPLTRPRVADAGQEGVRTPIDSFVLAKLKARGLSPSPEADRRTLIRRVTFDLIGLPPSVQEIDAFLADPAPDAYERLVDRLLASPRYGERWGRHWLDVVRYGETHGYDKDQPRPNAWPYRDYVIRSFNEDKPYGRFVEEQLAGDVLYPGTRDGIEALGFISAGPWDFIGHAEVPETKFDGQVARLLDRDDMVSNTLNTFSSLTIQCARCHDHKFDPVSQDDYYSLQAVFAALDRADRAYDADPAVALRRTELASRRDKLTREIDALLTLAKGRAGEALTTLDRRISRLETARKGRSGRSPAYGYHSGLSTSPESTRWVQIDLGKSVSIARVVLHACDDDFNAIGPGFGFPARFKVEASNDSRFEQGVTLIADRTGEDFANPRLLPVGLDTKELNARFVRVIATRLALRQNDYHFALAEVEVLDASGSNLAQSSRVTALDTIEAPPRWRLANLVDGDYPADDSDELPDLKSRREALVREALDEPARKALDETSRSLVEVDRQVGSLPPQAKIYAGTVHHGSGAFRGTGPDGGKPRVIRVLARGDLRSPRQVVGPGTVPIIEGMPARFDLSSDAPEGERRAALARWLTDRRNPLTWRSIVNRVWQYHFGRGLVDSPNDFGRMGQTPSNPELLDWLASEFRDGGQSLKQLHRLIVTSAVYRQVSSVDEAKAKIDGDNVLLWRMNRRRLEAEAIRDSVLLVAGKLDLTMGGPGFRDFVVEHPEHSPHYEYKLFDPGDPKAYRRSVYRFIVRSQPQPFLTALDCADPSMSVEKRNESTTALQALALLNDRLMVTMAAQLSARLENEAGDLPGRIDRAFLLAFGRAPTPPEREALIAHASKFGLANACRVLFNLNEFVFID